MNCRAKHPLMPYSGLKPVYWGRIPTPALKRRAKHTFDAQSRRFIAMHNPAFQRRDSDALSRFTWRFSAHV